MAKTRAEIIRHVCNEASSQATHPSYCGDFGLGDTVHVQTVCTQNLGKYLGFFYQIPYRGEFHAIGWIKEKIRVF
jgi:hypothetical protein